MNSKNYKRNCFICNKEFSCAKPKGKYCGNTCRNIDWRNKNREIYKEKQGNWIKLNYKQHLHNQSSYKTNRCKTDINYLLRRRVRARLGRIKAKCGIRTNELLGCHIDQLKSYLESKFQPNMSWDNYGKWHIDHIKPLSSFDLTDIGQFQKACHYTNLQPLWAIDNLRKGDTYE